VPEEKSQDLQKLINEITRKIKSLLKALDKERIAQANLQQISAALGTLIDRLIKLNALLDHQPDTKVVRIEYQYPDGKTADTPPWAADHPEIQQALQSGRMWQTLRQDGSGEDSGDRASAAGENSVVASADLPHERENLA
jgi:hypothetical protein